MSEAEREGAAAQLAQLRWQISRDAQEAGERLYAHMIDGSLDGTTEAEQLREHLPRLRTDVFKTSDKLDEYQRKHGG